MLVDHGGLIEKEEEVEKLVKGNCIHGVQRSEERQEKSTQEANSRIEDNKKEEERGARALGQEGPNGHAREETRMREGDGRHGSPT